MPLNCATIEVRMCALLNQRAQVWAKVSCVAVPDILNLCKLAERLNDLPGAKPDSNDASVRDCCGRGDPAFGKYVKDLALSPSPDPTALP